jgi:hypothetical protein
MVPYFLDDLEDDDQQNQNPGQVQISGASPNTDSQGNPDQNSLKAGPNTGSGFQNLDSYLNTNQSQNFGQQVLGKVEGEVNQAREGQQAGADQFKNQVSQANRLPSQEQLTNALANPVSANKDEFATWRDQGYEGPKNLAEAPAAWNQYWSGANKANTSAQLLGSEPGRFTLLDSYFGKPSYTYGQKALDNLLVQQSGLGKETRNVQNQAAGLNATGNQQSKDLSNFASQRAKEVQDSTKGVRQAVGIDDQGQVIEGAGAGAIGKAYQDVEKSLAEQNQERQRQLQMARDAAQGGNLFEGDLERFGLSAGQNLYNLDLQDYLTSGGDLNKNQAMGSDLRSRIQALSQLAGIEDTYTGEAEAVGSPYGFDTQRFLNDSGAGKQSYEIMANLPVKVGNQTLSYSQLQKVLSDSDRQGWNFQLGFSQEQALDALLNANQVIGQGRKLGTTNAPGASPASLPFNMGPRY